MTRDYLLLAYRGDDRVYVPHEQIAKVSKYIGADATAPALSKLGGKAWQNLKNRARTSLRELAGELFVCFPRPWAPSLHDLVVDALRETGTEARFQDSASATNTESLVAAGLGLTLSAPGWLAGAEGIVWRPLADVTIEIRTAAAWCSSPPRTPRPSSIAGPSVAYPSAIALSKSGFATRGRTTGRSRRA